MRRIDVIGIGIGIFAAGGIVYLGFVQLGFDPNDAGIWSQVVLVAALVGWLLTYLLRAVTQNMTYNQQLKDYEDAVLQKRLEAMTPEELAQLQAEVEQEKQQSRLQDQPPQSPPENSISE
jgi:membrane protein implicated in regulation of membrane protease activity